MSTQQEMQLVPPIEYKAPLRVERVENSNLMVRIVDADGVPVCTLGNGLLATMMVNGVNERTTPGDTI